MMRKCTTSALLLMLTCGVLATAADTADKAAPTVAEAIATVNAELVRQRETLAALHREHRERADRTLAKSAQLDAAADRLMTEIQQAETEAQALDQTHRQLETEASHLQAVQEQLDRTVVEFRRAFETGLNAADAAALAPELGVIDAMLAEPQAHPGAALEKLLDTGITVLEDALAGPVTRSGTGLDADGNEFAGTYLRVGPLTCFQSSDQRVTGVAVQQIGSLLPSIYTDFPAEQKAEFEALFRTGRGVVPLDVTLGDAIRLSGTEESLAEHLRKGGPTIVPLLALGVFCLLITIYKFVSLSAMRISRAKRLLPDILAALGTGDAVAARELAMSLGRPIGPVLLEGISHRDASKEHLEELLYEQMLSQVPALERFLSALAVCASAAPLLGLLGTVTGMIHTFRLITVFGTGDAKPLSGGISEALITTELGLIIAIPALLCHAFLARRVRTLLAVAQECAVMFVNGLKLRSGGQT